MGVRVDVQHPLIVTFFIVEMMLKSTRWRHLLEVPGYFFWLFLTMLVKSTATECHGPLSRSGTRHIHISPTIHGRPDLRCPAAGGYFWVSKRFITRAGINLNPDKSRSLVLKKGRVSNQFIRLSVSFWGTQRFHLWSLRDPRHRLGPYNLIAAPQFLAFYCGQVKTSQETRDLDHLLPFSSLMKESP